MAFWSCIARIRSRVRAPWTSGIGLEHCGDKPKDGADFNGITVIGLSGQEHEIKIRN